MTQSARAAATRQPEGIKARIIDAATSILRETGIQGLSQVQVSRRARVRQSHLTYYFPKRHDLIEAVAIQFVEHAFGTIGDAAAASSPRELPVVLQRMAAVVADESHMRMFTGVVVEADGDPELRAVLMRVTRRLQARLAERLTGNDAMERARLALSMLWGAGLYDFTMRPKRRARLTASLFARILQV